MAITVTCRCGKQFQVKDEHAGKRTTCPVCKQPLLIPGKNTPLSQPVEVPSPVPVTGPPGSRNRVFSPKLVLLIAGVCVLLVAVLVVVVAVSGSRSPAEVVKTTFFNANQGRYSDANKGLSSKVRAIQEQTDQTGMGKQLWDGVTRKGSIAKVDIIKEEVRGEGGHRHQESSSCCVRVDLLR